MGLSERGSAGGTGVVIVDGVGTSTATWAAAGAATVARVRTATPGRKKRAGRISISTRAPESRFLSYRQWKSRDRGKTRTLRGWVRAWPWPSAWADLGSSF